MLLNFMLVVSQLPPSRLSTLDPMQQKLQLMMQEDWRQLFVWPSQLVSRSLATSELMLVINGAMGTVQNICYRTGGPPDLPIAVMVHFDSYSGPTFHNDTVPITRLVAPGLPLGASVHIYNCLSSWHGLLPSTSLRVSLWTKLSLMSARVLHRPYICSLLTGPPTAGSLMQPSLLISAFVKPC